LNPLLVATGEEDSKRAAGGDILQSFCTQSAFPDVELWGKTESMILSLVLSRSSCDRIISARILAMGDVALLEAAITVSR
jgi:hypothetical protein